LLVDDHKILRMGLRQLFETVPSVAIVGEADTAAGAIATARRCAPDVVLMDVRLPDGSGIDACRAIRSERPATRVIMLTSFSEEEVVLAAVMAGAAGYLLKQMVPDRLVEAVEMVAHGDSLLDPLVTRTVLDRMC